MNGNYVLQMDASEQDFWRLLGWTDTIIVGFRTGFARKEVGSEESEEEEKPESEEKEKEVTQGHMSQVTIAMDEKCKAVHGKLQPKKKRKHICVVQ